MESDLQAQYR